MTTATITKIESRISSASTRAAGASLAGRLMLASLFLVAGFGKIAAPTVTIAYIRSAGLPAPEVAYAIAVAVEVLGALTLVAGFHTRLVALVMAAFAVATALAFHNHLGDQNQMIHFLKNISIAGGLLQVAAFGAGRFSLDARR
jgi:putative oxidoreductase